MSLAWKPSPFQQAGGWIAECDAGTYHILRDRDSSVPWYVASFKKRGALFPSQVGNDSNIKDLQHDCERHHANSTKE